MNNRKKLLDGSLVTAYSSSLSAGETPLGWPSGRMPARHRQSGSTTPDALVGALRSRNLWRPSPAATSTAKRVRRRIRRESTAFQHGLPQLLFMDALARERKRAERFGQPFTLLLVEMPAIEAASATTSIAAAAADALSATCGETAIVGWLEEQSVLGAIIPEATIGWNRLGRLREELARRIDPDVVDQLPTHTHFFPGSTTKPAEARAGHDLLMGFLPVKERARIAHYALKRCLDIAGSFALLMLLSPVFLLTAILLKLTSAGPIMFRQARIGRMGKPFMMLKFRTMRVNADSALHRQFVTQFIRSSGQLQPSDGTATFKLTNDPRVTPIGRILRKTSLDELPQLWNVLRGDMSLVGPRPALGYEVEQYRPWQWRRVLEAKPGITGLWQVEGRSRTTFEEMVRLDIRYARTCSFRNDIRILLATPRAVISGTGAH
jgi:lipopolysaccharide/colanic/teichoic acid biosynthesis glycosyltransferase